MSQRQDLVVEGSREHLVEKDLKQVKKYRLNHCATEFVSSESSVGGESDNQSEEDAEQENSGCAVCETTPLKTKARDERPAMQGRGSTTGMQSDPVDQSYANGYAWGWESPQVRFRVHFMGKALLLTQFSCHTWVLWYSTRSNLCRAEQLISNQNVCVQGVLPATPHGVDPSRYMSMMRPGSPPNPMASAPEHNGEEEEEKEDSQSPSGNAAARQNSQHVIHQYNTGYHLPYHGPPYPVYGYPQEHGERSSSPQPMFPGGGSPPLAPGFFSVPVGISSSGGSSPPAHPMMMYGCSPPNSLGSSPPGGAHYYFMPPMHAVHQSHEFDARYDVSHQLGNMSLSSSSTKSNASGKPGEARASARIARSNRAGGAYNPQDFEFNVEEAKLDNDEARKTIMIRNIPNKYSQAVMLGMLEKAGLGYVVFGSCLDRTE